MTMFPMDKPLPEPVTATSNVTPGTVIAAGMGAYQLYGMAGAQHQGTGSYMDAAMAGAMVGSPFGPLGMAIGAAAGLAYSAVNETFDTNRFKTEGNRLQSLLDQGVEIPESMRAPMALRKGRSRGELAAIEQAKIDEGGYGNVEFAKTRDESKLKAEDIWGYAAFFEKYGNDWLGKFSEEERRNIAQKALDSGAVREAKGSINIDWSKVEGAKEDTSTPSEGEGTSSGAPTPVTSVGSEFAPSGPKLNSALRKAKVPATLLPNFVVQKDTPISRQYIPIQNAGNNRIAAPIEDAILNLKSFELNTQEDYLKDASLADADRINKKAGAVLASAGVFYGNMPGAVQVGTDELGKPIYANEKLLKEPSPVLGGMFADAFRTTLAPTGVLSVEEQEALKALGDRASMQQTILKLDESRSPDEFIKGLNAIASTGKEPGNPTPEGAYSAYSLYKNWGVMSTSQKAIAIASQGVQNFKFADGSTPETKEFIPTKDNVPGVTVSKGLDLTKKGVNIYGLQKNWDQINKVAAAVGFEGDIDDKARFAQENGLLGFGEDAAAIPGIKYDNLKQRGWEDALQYGVGAIAGDASLQIPEGYTKVANTKEGGQIIVPIPTQFTAMPAVNQARLSTGEGVGGVSETATKLYRSWTPKESNPQKGINGGSALVSGLAQIQRGNPTLFSQVTNQALSSNVTNKPIKKDNQFKKANIISGNKVELIPGEKIPLARVDKNSPSSYLAGIAGVSLSRLVHGDKSEDVDNVGGRLGASVATFFPTITKENFGGAMQAMRSLYARMGINSKADAYQLSNQALSENRIDESDLLGMYKTFDMVFDADYSAAQLMLKKR